MIKTIKKTLKFLLMWVSIELIDRMILYYLSMFYLLNLTFIYVLFTQFNVYSFYNQLMYFRKKKVL